MCLDYVTRIHLKTDTKYRKELIEFSLNNKKEQYIAIGWQYIYETAPASISSYEDYYEKVDYHAKVEADKNKRKKHLNPVLNVFKQTKEGDLFWTRDLNGYYWICKALGPAKPIHIEKLDIGAVVPVKAYKYGIEAPGQLKASFNRFNGGTCQKLRDKTIITFSKFVFNNLSETNTYEIKYNNFDFLGTLPDFDLEELVISYIQIKENYYVLSNSIANKSTTIKIECEFTSRDKKNPKKAVVQVKGGKTPIYATDYQEFLKNDYEVYLFADEIKDKKLNDDEKDKCHIITREELLSFYNDYKEILPKNITDWEKLLNSINKINHTKR